MHGNLDTIVSIRLETVVEAIEASAVWVRSRQRPTASHAPRTDA